MSLGSRHYWVVEAQQPAQQILHQPWVQRGAELLEAALTLKFSRTLLCGCLQTMMVGMSRATRSSTRTKIQVMLASFRAFTLRVSTTQMIVTSTAAREEPITMLHSTWLYRPPCHPVGCWAEPPPPPGHMQVLRHPTQGLGEALCQEELISLASRVKPVLSWAQTQFWRFPRPYWAALLCLHNETIDQSSPSLQGPTRPSPWHSKEPAMWQDMQELLPPTHSPMIETQT